MLDTGELSDYYAANQGYLEALIELRAEIGKTALPDSVLVLDLAGHTLEHTFSNPEDTDSPNASQRRLTERISTNWFVVTAEDYLTPSLIDEIDDEEPDAALYPPGQITDQADADETTIESKSDPSEAARATHEPWVVESEFYYPRDEADQAMLAFMRLHKADHPAPLNGIFFERTVNNLRELLLVVQLSTGEEPTEYSVLSSTLLNPQNDGLIESEIATFFEYVDAYDLRDKLTTDMAQAAEDVTFQGDPGSYLLVFTDFDRGQHCYDFLMNEARTDGQGAADEETLGISLPETARLIAARQAIERIFAEA